MYPISGTNSGTGKGQNPIGTFGEKEESGKPIIIAAVLVLIFALVGIGAFSLLNRTDNSVANSTDKVEEGGTSDSSEDVINSDDIDSSTAIQSEPDVVKILPTAVPEEYFYYNGHTYAFYDASRYGFTTYDEVSDFCHDQGGHLAVINDRTENSYLYDLMKENYMTTVFFGYTDKDQEGNWVWDADNSDYENWTKSGDWDLPDNGERWGGGEQEGGEDYAEFNFKETISPRVAADGKFDDKELLVYDCFVRVWDFYDSIGWTGPDDEGTPSLLLMDMVTEKGDPIQNACYAGKSWGFQTFAFNRIDFDGECTDVIAHEFTHCVTSTTMTTNLYVNDLGAINEGMSDILGNLVEMLIEDQPEGAWIIGENEGGENPYRSMSDPHKYAQPEFAWDAYYGPAVVEPSPANDNGGVHINSSMLNIISYKLDQAGMEPSDQFYFWMNVALAMSPLTDYPQMVYLLPWCMEQAGYPQYVDALNKAIEEAKYSTTELSSTLPENTGVITIQLPDEALSLAGSLRLTVVNEDTELTCVSWPEGETGKMTVVLPAGNYALGLELFDGDGPIETKLYGESGWKTRESELDFSETATVKAGETVELTSVGLDQWSAATESAADAA